MGFGAQRPMAPSREVETRDAQIVLRGPTKRDIRLWFETWQCQRLNLPAVDGIADGLCLSGTHDHAAADRIFGDASGATADVTGIAGARIVERTDSASRDQ